MKSHIIEPRLIDALLEAQTPVMPAADRVKAMRDRVMAGARAGKPEQPVQPAQDHLTIHQAEGRWLPILSGIEMKVLREDASTRSYLLRMAAGARLPAHGHSHEEECMVLEGDVWLGEVHARAGDYHLARSGLPHGELHSDGGCLLFLRGQKHYPDMHPG